MEADWSDLLPCPFCGSTDLSVTYDRYRRERVACRCGCTGVPMTLWQGRPDPRQMIMPLY